MGLLDLTPDTDVIGNIIKECMVKIYKEYSPKYQNLCHFEIKAYKPRTGIIFPNQYVLCYGHDKDFDIVHLKFLRIDKYPWKTTKYNVRHWYVLGVRIPGIFDDGDCGYLRINLEQFYKLISSL